jgi:hypothetical protein
MVKEGLFMNLTELAGVGGQINISNGSDALAMRNILDQQNAQEDTQRQATVAATAVTTKNMERSVRPHLGGTLDISA